MSWQILQGNCVKVMAAMPEASVDAVVCDPPYAIDFMGRTWDRHGDGFQDWCEQWATEALRVLKPGGHLLAFGGTRTSHRLVCGIEDAGFEIRDTIMWLHGSGFPKSLDVSKAIDKAEGAERTQTGREPRLVTPRAMAPGGDERAVDPGARFDAPATPNAELWDGWGTALKPAHEPIVVARKPLAGTVAANVLQHGTGALNIDGCRIATDDQWKATGVQSDPSTSLSGGADGSLNVSSTHERGRWPANVVLSHSPGCRETGTRTVRGDNRSAGGGTRPAGFADIGAAVGDGEPNAPVYGDAEVPVWECAEDCAVRMLDEQTGTLTSGSGALNRSADKFGRSTFGRFEGRDEPADVLYGDSGGASRFFYCAKADSAERNAGLSVTSLFTPADAPERNDHPTVKPIDLMRWLVRLVTPPGGVVLDPFAGSGTTLCAAVLEGFDCIGVEREAAYAAICRARLAHWASGTAERPAA